MNTSQTRQVFLYSDHDRNGIFRFTRKHPDWQPTERVRESWNLTVPRYLGCMASLKCKHATSPYVLYRSWRIHRIKRLSPNVWVRCLNRLGSNSHYTRSNMVLNLLMWLRVLLSLLNGCGLWMWHLCSPMCPPPSTPLITYVTISVQPVLTSK